ncbi:MAG TPA: prohibitin family protein [Candidatus Portnoybacteria bacterium]|nr:prohibitin family protein [Candidatus Portnoybacteria bacterium]
MVKKIAVIILLVVSVLPGLMACSKVPAGNVGVKVYLLGKEKGVDSEELGPGRYWIGINEELYLFPTFTQNYVWTKNPVEGSPNDESITFQTKEGLSVNADVGISYHIDPQKVSIVFQKYRKGVDEITDIYLRNMVRDALVKSASTKPIESVYGEGKAALLGEVEEGVRQQCKPIGIVIEKISFIGDFRLPKQVVNAINAKIEATQKAQQRENEVAEAKAAADKLRAQAKGQADAILLKAKAQAEANRIIAASLTPELVKYKAIEKWSGKMPYVTGSGSMPLVNIPQ